MSLLLKEYNSSAGMSPDSNENKRCFDWNQYVESFISLISVASSIEECEENVNSLLDNLLKYDCEDFALSVKLIDFIAVYRNSRDLENREEAIAKGLIAGESAREKGENYYECMQELNARNFILALRRSDSRLLRLFMKYGINVLAADQDTEKEEIMRISKRFYYYAFGVERVLDDMVLAREEVLAASEFMAETFYNAISERREPEQHTRLMQIMLGVEAVLRMRRRNGTHQEYVECVRIYFRDIAWPFVSSSEVRFILGTFGCKKPLFVESLCRDFNELFPEFPKTHHAPRSLKEMCRAEVREIMTCGYGQPTKTLPVAVSTFCIPHTLKNYLLGDE